MHILFWFGAFLAALFVASFGTSVHAQSNDKHKYTINFDVRIDSVPNVKEVHYNCKWFHNLGNGGYTHRDGKATFNPRLSEKGAFVKVSETFESDIRRVSYECKVKHFVVQSRGGKAEQVPPFTTFEKVLDMSRTQLVSRGRFTTRYPKTTRRGSNVQNQGSQSQNRQYPRPTRR